MDVSKSINVDLTQIEENSAYVVLVDVANMTIEQRVKLFDAFKVNLKDLAEKKHAKICVIPHYNNVRITNLAKISDSDLANLGLKKL